MRAADGFAAAAVCPPAPAPAAVSAARAADAVGTAGESFAVTAAAAARKPAAVGKVLVMSSDTAGMQVMVTIAAVRVSLVLGAFVTVWEVWNGAEVPLEV